MMQFVRTSVEPLGAAPSAVTEMLKRIELAAGMPCIPQTGLAAVRAGNIVDLLKERGQISALEHSNIVLKVLSTHFEMDFFSKVDGRIWFHRLHTAGEHTYLAGNLRAWLESCRHMEARGGFNWPEIPVFLHETFPALFPRVPISPEYRLYNLELVSPEEQLTICKVDPRADLAVFSFKIACDAGCAAGIPRYRSLSVTPQTTGRGDDPRKLLFILPEEWEYCYDEANESVDTEKIKEPDAAVHEHFRRSAELHGKMAGGKNAPPLARDLLPHLLGTRMIVSGPLSAWRIFLPLRNHPDEHPRLRYIAQSVKSWFDYVGLHVG